MRKATLRKASIAKPLRSQKRIPTKEIALCGEPSCRRRSVRARKTVCDRAFTATPPRFRGPPTDILQPMKKRRLPSGYLTLRSVTVPHSLSPGMKASARMKPAGLVQLRLRLRRVPVRSRRDVLQLGLEKIVQEFLLRVLHLRKDLARGRRSDSVDRVGVDRSLPIYRDQVCDLFRSPERLSFLVREVQFPRALRIRVSNGPCSPPEHGQKPRFALRTLRMIGHFPDPDLLVKVSTLEAEQVDRLR